VYERLTESRDYGSLLDYEPDAGVALSLECARYLASMYSGSAETCAALHDAQGGRISNSARFMAFFGLEPTTHADRIRPGRLGRDVWGSERSRFVQTTAITGRPTKIIEIAAGYRVETHLACIQDPSVNDQLVFQTSRRVMLSETDTSWQDQRDCSFALYGTWGGIEGLSRRQMEVLRLVTQRLGNDEIGAVIRRTKRAVEWHIRGLFAKLKVSDRVDLTRIGTRAGLNNIPDDVWAQILARRYGASQL
jgi:DNA-binding CsgD family transcriptional regulator